METRKKFTLLFIGNIFAGFVIYLIAGLIVDLLGLFLSFAYGVAFIYIGGIIASLFLVQLSILMDRHGKKRRQPIYELGSLIVLIITYFPPIYFFASNPYPLVFIAVCLASVLIYVFGMAQLPEPEKKEKRNLKIMV
jgi:hypothetical protein